jgi:hypothetical protein
MKYDHQGSVKTIELILSQFHWHANRDQLKLSEATVSLINVEK